MKQLNQTASITHMMLKRDLEILDTVINNHRKVNIKSDFQDYFSLYFKILKNKNPVQALLPRDPIQNKIVCFFDDKYYFVTNYIPKKSSLLFNFATSNEHDFDNKIYVDEHNKLRLVTKFELTDVKLKILQGLSALNYQPALDYFMHQVMYHCSESAKRYLKFNKYRLLGFTIYLPKLFKTAHDYKKLGTALILNKNNWWGSSVKGEYFELEDGSRAQQLGQMLLQKANEMSKNYFHNAIEKYQKISLDNEAGSIFCNENDAFCTGQVRNVLNEAKNCMI